MKSTSISMADWLSGWLLNKQAQLTDKTHANYQHLLHKHILPTLGLLDVECVTPTTIHDFYAHLSGQGYSNSLLHQVRVILSQALQEATDQGVISANPAARVRPSRRKARRRARALTTQEMQRFLSTAASLRLASLFIFAALTGLRRGEICALKWEHVDLENGVLFVRENVTLANGKVTTGAPKTEAGRLTLHLAPETVELLKRHRSQQTEERQPREDTGFVFTNQWGRRLYPDSLSKLAKRLGKEAGLGNMRFHDLRHTYASLMMQQGVPLEVVSEKLGHSRPSTTVDIYRHVYAEEHERHTLDLVQLMKPKPLKLQVNQAKPRKRKVA